VTITANSYEQSESKIVKWVGWKVSDRYQQCTVEAKTWVLARELVQALLRTNDVEVVRDFLPDCQWEEI